MRMLALLLSLTGIVKIGSPVNSAIKWITLDYNIGSKQTALFYRVFQNRPLLVYAGKRKKTMYTDANRYCKFFSYNFLQLVHTYYATTNYIRSKTIK